MEYIVQEKQMGFGHALIEAQRSGLQDETLAVITPDESVDPACLRKMIDLYRERRSPIVAVRKMRPGPHRLYGIVRGKDKDGVIAVTRLEEKPKDPPNPAWVLLGRYVLPPHVFKVLAETPENTHSGNIELTDALQAMITKSQAIDAYVHKGPFRSLGPTLDELLKELDRSTWRPPA